MRHNTIYYRQLDFFAGNGISIERAAKMCYTEELTYAHYVAYVSFSW